MTKNNFLYSDFFEIIASKVFIFSVLSRTCHARFILLRPLTLKLPFSPLSASPPLPRLLFPSGQKKCGWRKGKDDNFPFHISLVAVVRVSSLILLQGETDASSSNFINIYTGCLRTLTLTKCHHAYVYIKGTSKCLTLSIQW